ncbi:class I SAM-dependent methyltransferase [Prauserella flavalba]|uniref:class I SAM-dependent methyltransferase n=1 Tax=Prauserella flavalba TaxID=1477506 RepID=UPI001FEB2408|nr:class I SAM-dependent methyltransferase [Prauserella flavalba]
MDEVLRTCPGGELLDAGCGPGVLLRRLVDTRPGDFGITGCDQSAAMIEVARERLAGAADVRLTVADIEDLPFPERSFDVVVAMGVLEYTDALRALRELARVVRHGGLVVVTMLNPRSPYRLFEWSVYWPAVRLLGHAERWAGVPPERRHAASRTGIRALSRRRLCRLFRGLGLRPVDIAYYDVTPLLPPFDRIVRKWARRWRAHPETTVSRGARRWLGTAYLVAAR